MSVVRAESLVKWSSRLMFPLYLFMVHLHSFKESLNLKTSSFSHLLSQDTPHFFEGRTYLGTGQCCREGVITDGYGLLCVVHIHLKTQRSASHIWCLKQCLEQQIYWVVSHRSMCKRSNHHCSRSLWHQSAGTDSLSRGEGSGNAGAARRQMVRHWVFNHPQKLLRTISGPDTQLVQQLNWNRREDRIFISNTGEEKLLPFTTEGAIYHAVCGFYAQKE